MGHEIEALCSGQQAARRPVIYLLANKSDKDPIGQDYVRLFTKAQQYAETKAIKRLVATSALELKGVRQVFRMFLVDILAQHPSLWRNEDMPKRTSRLMRQVLAPAGSPFAGAAADGIDAGPASFEDHLQSARQAAEKNCVAQ